MPETALRDWRAATLAAVAAIVALRIVALAFDRTDLFVDEAQYWLWGQSFEAGYYSKPPLIAWVIGALTALAGSDAPFWVRLPGPVLHGATALILAAAARLVWDARAGFWTALTYVTLPFTAVGSAMISTDTVLAPFYAGAIYFTLRAQREGGPGWAALAGASLGAAFLAKYAALYFLIGLALAWILVPAMRLRLAQVGAFLAALALVAAPNLLWNLSHDLTTVSHTIDNAGWVRRGAEGGLGGIARAGEFLAAQAGVFGPVTIAALVLAFRRWRDPHVRWFLCLALPPLVLVTGQAFLSKAYANWGLTAYFPGTLAAIALLCAHPHWLRVSLVLNAVVCLTIPLLTALAPFPQVDGKPLLSRYLGRAALSEAIVETTRAEGLQTVVATNRDVLADLFYTARDEGLAIHARPPRGRPLNFFEQTHALPAGGTGNVLAVLDRPPPCRGERVTPVRTFDTKGTAYDGRTFAAYVVPAACLDRG